MSMRASSPALSRTLLGFVALVGLVVGSAACSKGSLGAVSFRWRLVDKSSGALASARDYPDPDGSGGCRCVRGQRDCATSCGWAVSRVRLRAASLVDGVPTPLDLDAASTQFACSVGEATTAFKIPPGTLALTIDGFVATDSGDVIQATGPSPIVRTIVANQVVNLDIVELAVAQQPIYAADAGPVPSVLDFGCP